MRQGSAGICSANAQKLLCKSGTARVAAWHA